MSIFGYSTITITYRIALRQSKEPLFYALMRDSHRNIRVDWVVEEIGKVRVSSCSQIFISIVRLCFRFKHMCVICSPRRNGERTNCCCGGRDVLWIRMSLFSSPPLLSALSKKNFSKVKPHNKREESSARHDCEEVIHDDSTNSRIAKRGKSRAARGMKTTRRN